MIVWSGLGFLVAVITFGFCLLANFVLDAQWGEGYYSSHHWAIGTALILGGLVSSGVGFLLKKRSEDGISHHSFFFIPMHWAGIVIAVIGLGLAVSEVFQ